jgi:hypothetical protein
MIVLVVFKCVGGKRGSFWRKTIEGNARSAQASQREKKIMGVRCV